jgi:hypothetical protein
MYDEDNDGRFPDESPVEVASSTKAAPIIRLWAASDVVALDLPLA